MLAAAALAVAAPATSAFPGDSGADEPPLSVEIPAVLLAGVPRAVTVRAEGAGQALKIEARIDGSGARRSAELPAGAGEVAIDIAAPRGARWLEVTARSADGAEIARIRRPLRVISSFWAFVPPLLAIGLALAIRQVLPSLLLGVLAGAWLRTGSAGRAPLRLLDHDLIRALNDVDHLKIILFTLMLGGMAGLIARSGGAGGLVEAVSGWARTRRTGQVSGWIAGLVVFFDDYANTLIVGPTVRPLTDRLRISREKLAFIVDATAAPVASIALISTWIGYEVGLIADALPGTRLAGTDAYGLFIASLPYRFYAWLMLAFGLLVAVTGRDFGPMARAERRAAGGAVLRPGSQPLTRTDLLDGAPASTPRAALWLAVAPILAVVAVTGLTLWFSGRASLAADGDPNGTAPVFSVLLSVRRLGAVIGAASSFDALLYGAACGVLVAVAASVALRRLALGPAIDAFTDGVRSMMLAVMILTLAWMIGGVCKDLDTAGAALAWIGDGFPVRLLPAMTFLLAAAISFATGTSWSTMAVLVPIALPLADRLAAASAWPDASASRLLVAVTGSVLTGSVFGDHCSPISDTTVMSSLASGCDHIDHVRTQLPYAAIVAAVAILVGDLAVGFGIPPWLGLLAGIAALFGLLRLVGRPSEEASVP
ncbi:MAG: Na+/H+ antiporter NhaC family protein [Acidobacteria bacterium]|nr:MAG: Na+/H+ antiporter NhaC family protein [Acidobacteriota bacterium]